MDTKNIQYEMLEFTRRFENRFYDTVDLDDFKDKEVEYIYDTLQKNLRPIPFGDYLKRYICRQSGIAENHETVDIKDYQEIISETFRENRTPASFDETKAKIGALAKNWLTQDSVNRQTVFLLGFGLNMSADDVSEFLVKALKERDFNFKNPIEIIYWYCFKNNFNFAKMQKLKEAFEILPPSKDSSIFDEKTGIIRDMFQDVSGDAELLAHLANFKIDERRTSYSVTSRRWFDDLYSKTKEIIAGYYNKDEEEKLEMQIQEYMDETRDSPRLTDLDKRNRTDKMRKERKIWTASEMDEGIVEKILCGGTPIDESGNLLKISESSLSRHFGNKRLRRQHLGDIIANKTTIERFDLITLNFFIFSQDEKYSGDTNNQRRFNDFIESTNKILNDCSMGELYMANPYECFLLMCIVSDDPFPNYTEIIEKSFDE